MKPPGTVSVRSIPVAQTANIQPRQNRILNPMHHCYNG